MHKPDYGILGYKWITQCKTTRFGIDKQELKKFSFSGFCCSSGPQSENKSKRKAGKISVSCQTNEKMVEYEHEVVGGTTLE